MTDSPWCSLRLNGMMAAIAAGLAGCAPQGPHEAPAPALSLAAAFRAAPQTATQTAAQTAPGRPVLLGNAEWWRRLDDPTLDRLVALALRDSLTIEQAMARLTEARANTRSLAGAFAASPRLSGRASRGDGAGADTAVAEIGLDWLLDPWGGRRAERQAAAARAGAAAAEAEAARLLVLSRLGQTYLDLRYRQRLLALAEQEARSRARTLALTRTMAEAEAATRLEVTRSQARVAGLQAELPALRAAILARQNEIAVLSGVAPGSLPPDLAAALVQGHGQPRPALAPDPGIPADLLRNRPDIRVAEQEYYAALAELDQARAALYPGLSLSGAVTLTRAGGQTTQAGYFGPALRLPAFPADAARAGVEARHARVRAAHAIWRTTVLGAVLEVENALLDYRAVSSSEAAALRAARLHREVLDLTRDLFAGGEATLGDLIDAEQAVAEADQVVAETRYRRGLGFVALNVALGAGHGMAPPPR